MRVLTVELIFTILPAAIFRDIWTSLWIVEEEVGRTAEVLLPMRIVALTPVVDR